MQCYLKLFNQLYWTYHTYIPSLCWHKCYKTGCFSCLLNPVTQLCPTGTKKVLERVFPSVSARSQSNLSRIVPGSTWGLRMLVEYLPDGENDILFHNTTHNLHLDNEQQAQRSVVDSHVWKHTLSYRPAASDKHLFTASLFPVNAPHLCFTL